MINYEYDHDRYVRKNRMIASGYNVDKHDSDMEKKGFSRYERQKDASFDGKEKFICDRYTPEPAGKKAMSDKQIKSLLKNIKKGRY